MGKRSIRLCLLRTTLSLLAVLLISGIMLAEENDHWATGVLEDLKQFGLYTDFSSSELNPDAPMSGAQFANALSRVLGFNQDDRRLYITDDFPFAEDSPGLQLALRFYHIYLDEEGYLLWDAAITRQEAFAILAELLGLTPNPARETRFSDEGLISPWARDAVLSLVDARYAAGWDGALHPRNALTFAQFAATLQRIFPTVIDNELDLEGGILLGNALIRNGGASLSNAIVSGAIFINEGIAGGSVALTNVVAAQGITITNCGEAEVILTGVRSAQLMIRETWYAGTIPLLLDSSDCRFEEIAIAGNVILAGNLETVQLRQGAAVTIAPGAGITTIYLAPDANAQYLTVSPGGYLGSLDVAFGSSLDRVHVAHGAAIEQILLQGYVESLSLEGRAASISILADAGSNLLILCEHRDGTELWLEGQVTSLITARETNISGNGVLRNLEAVALGVQVTESIFSSIDQLLLAEGIAITVGDTVYAEDMTP